MSLAHTFLVRGILVDMDGTVVDSNRIVDASWQKVCATHFLDPAEVLPFAHGRPASVTLDHYLPHLSVKERRRIEQEMHLAERELAHLVVQIPGAMNFLTQLETLGVPWALVTSAPRPLARARFENASLPWPRVSVTVEDVVAGKPDPWGYKRAAELLGIRTSDALVFEDVVPGVQAGLSSGASVVVVGNTDTSELGDLPRVSNLESVSIKPSNEVGLFTVTVG